MFLPFRLAFALGFLCLLGCIPPALALDRETLTRLGGVYGGEFTIDQRAVESDELVEGPIVDTTGGRVVLPRRNGQSIRGTISFGLALLDFDERVRRIRERGSAALYTGRIQLYVRDVDDVPFVGIYVARARVSGERERLRLRFRATKPAGDSAPDRTFVLRGRFQATR